ncbi:MAG: hypothetical protein FD143_3718, partial [Ignavibacteria bacterium]
YKKFAGINANYTKIAVSVDFSSKL